MNIYENFKIYYEAVTQKQKDYFSTFNQKVIEEIDLGQHDLVLVDMSKTPVSFIANYQIGIQAHGEDFTDPYSHEKRKTQTTRAQIASLFNKKIIDIIKNWIEKYGDIIIGSESEKKMKFYRKIFDRFDIKYRKMLVPCIIGYIYVLTK